MTRYALYRNGLPYSVMTASNAARDANFSRLRTSADKYEWLIVDMTVITVAQSPAYDAAKVKPV